MFTIVEQVDVVLRNGMFLCDILNLVETVEYALSVVTEATSAVSFWLNTVDIPHKYVPSSFPSSAFDGKHLNVAINLQQCGVAIKGLFSIYTSICNAIFRYVAQICRYTTVYG